MVPGAVLVLPSRDRHEPGEIVDHRDESGSRRRVDGVAKEDARVRKFRALAHKPSTREARVLLALCAGMSTSCDRSSWGPWKPDCLLSSDDLYAAQPTPFGPTGLEVADSVASARLHLQWTAGSSVGFPEVDELYVTTALNNTVVLGVSPVGTLRVDSPTTSYCTGQPSDHGGLRLSLLTHLSSLDQIFTATGLQMLYLSGPDLDRDQAGFNQSWAVPLVVTTTDEALLARAAATDERVDPTVSPQTFLAKWYGWSGESELGEMMQPYLLLYVDAGHKERGERFAEATVEVEWLSDPLWDEGSTP